MMLLGHRRAASLRLSCVGSDAKFDCPNAMNLQLVEGSWWFEYMGAITLHASNVTLERSYTLALPSSFDFDGKTIGIANKTVHTVVHIAEPRTSASTARLVSKASGTAYQGTTIRERETNQGW